MRIAIMGSGGLGGLFGGLLNKAGADVLFIARGQQLEALQNSGLSIVSDLGNLTCRISPSTMIQRVSAPSILLFSPSRDRTPKSRPI